MNRHALYVAVFALMVGGAFGVSCTTAQPPLECNFLPLYWAKYDLTSVPDGGGACQTYQGDRVDFQRYQAPGATSSTFAMLPRRVGRIGRFDPCTGAADGRAFRTDPTDTEFQKESARGTYPSTLPNAAGFCAATSIVPAEQSFPEVTVDTCNALGIDPYNHLSDGGVSLKTPLPKPATHYKDTWSNYRQLSTARFTGNIWEADVQVVRDSCEATYHVTGFFPPVGCDTADGDEDCNPNANLDKGRAVGSGIAAEFAPKCVELTSAYELGYIANFPGGINGVTNTLTGNVNGVCVPTKSLDDLAALK